MLLRLIETVVYMHRLGLCGPYIYLFIDQWHYSSLYDKGCG